MPPATVLRGSEHGNRYSPTGREILTGVRCVMIDVTDPPVDRIFIADIARSLARQERFTGHCPLRPTVAQHSLAVEHIGRVMYTEVDADPVSLVQLSRALLMHDAPEYLTSDLNGATKCEIRPMVFDPYDREPPRRGTSKFDKLEALAAERIAERFGCSTLGWEESVHEADCLACSYEMAYDGWCPEATPPAWLTYDGRLATIYSRHLVYDGGEAAFLRRAAELGMVDA